MKIWIYGEEWWQWVGHNHQSCTAIVNTFMHFRFPVKPSCTTMVNTFMHFRFPVKPQGLRRAWEKSIGVKNFRATEHHVLCSVHFLPNQLCKNGSIRQGAAPCLFIDPDYPAKVCPLLLQRYWVCHCFKAKLRHTLKKQICDGCRILFKTVVVWFSSFC